jgi:hypothetical protein
VSGLAREDLDRHPPVVAGTTQSVRYFWPVDAPGSERQVQILDSEVVVDMDVGESLAEGAHQLGGPVGLFRPTLEVCVADVQVEESVAENVSERLVDQGAKAKLLTGSHAAPLMDDRQQAVVDYELAASRSRG